MEKQTSVGRDRRAFIRDRPTQLSYGLLGAYAFWLYGFGPALAFLRADLHFSYTVLGLYSVTWAIGSIAAGGTFESLVDRTGQSWTLWGSAAMTVCGAALFLLAGGVTWTVVAAFIMGCGGTLLQTAVQSVLSAQHNVHRDKALVEANLGAGICSLVAPVALGLLQATPATWRTAMVLPVLPIIALYVVYGRDRLQASSPRPAATAGSHSERLSLTCWLLCLLVAIGIGVEFCVLYFGAQLLSVTVGLTTASAAGAMTLVYIGILIGRGGGAVLTRRSGRTDKLLWVSLVATLVGLCVVWVSRNTIIALSGLLMTGVGIANQFPLALAATLAAAPGRTNAANARAQLLGAIFLLLAPFLLGALGDAIGLALAFAVAPALTLLSGMLLSLAGRLREQ